MAAEHGHFYWNELMTTEVAAIRSFYADTLGWSFSDMPMGDGGTYTVVMDGETPIGGIFDASEPGAQGFPKGWFAYIAVDDVDARLEKAKNAGGAVLREPFDVPGVGRIAIVQQPDGASVGWMTPAPQEG